jgi:hypothetical protein
MFYFVGYYDFSNKKKPSVMLDTWILPYSSEDVKKIGTRCFIFFHKDPNADPPQTIPVKNLIRQVSQDNPEGFFYPGIILKRFGKKIYQICEILTNI